MKDETQEVPTVEDAEPETGLDAQPDNLPGILAAYDRFRFVEDEWSRADKTAKALKKQMKAAQEALNDIITPGPPLRDPSAIGRRDQP